MTFKEKYYSIDQTKLPEKAKVYMEEFKKDTKNFTDKEAMKIIMPTLDGFIKKLKESGYESAIKTSKTEKPKKEKVVKKKTAKEMVKEIVEEAVEQPKTTKGQPKMRTIKQGDYMRVAKEIRKEGEPWKDALKRAKEFITTQKEVKKEEAKRQYQKLKEFIEKQPEYYPKDIPTPSGGHRGTTLERDAVRVALPKGKRISKKTGKTYYEYRSNRIDKRRDDYPYLAKGGEVDAIFDKGGKIPQDKSLKYFIMNEASSGSIANKVPYSSYKDIDGIRLTAYQILLRDGDREYSLQAFTDLIKQAVEEYEENKYEMSFSDGGEIVRNKSKNDWNSKLDFFFKYNYTPVGKGALIQMAYDDTKGVDSAIPQSLWGEVDNTMYYVYDYNDNKFGELVDLREKLKFSNTKVDVTIVKDGNLLYKNNLPEELKNATFHQALDYVFKNDDVTDFSIKPKGQYADGGMTKRMIALPVGTREQIEESIRMGYDTLIEGMISPKTRGVMLIDKDSNVRGTYPMLYKGAIEEILHNIKGYAKGGEMRKPTNQEVYDGGDIIDSWSSDIGGSNESEDNVIEYEGNTYLVSTNAEDNSVIKPKSKAQIYEYSKGGELDINKYAGAGMFADGGEMDTTPKKLVDYVESTPKAKNILKAVYESRIDALKGEMDYYEKGADRYYHEQVRGNVNDEIERISRKIDGVRDDIDFLEDENYPIDLVMSGKSYAISFLNDLNDLVRTKAGKKLFNSSDESSNREYLDVYYTLYDLVDETFESYKDIGYYKYAKGGYTTKGEDYEYVNTFGIPQNDFKEMVDAWHKTDSYDQMDRIESRLVFRRMTNKYGKEKVEEINKYIWDTHNAHEHSGEYAKGGEMSFMKPIDNLDDFKFTKYYVRNGKDRTMNKHFTSFSDADDYLDMLIQKSKIDKSYSDGISLDGFSEKYGEFYTIYYVHKGRKKAFMFRQGKYAKGGEMGDVRIGDILITSTGVKVVVVDYDSMFGGRIKAVRMDEYATGKSSQWMPVNKFKKYAKGGKIGFKGLSDKVAKYYTNKKVPSKYQNLYGKTYDKQEAKEVGDKVAAKVYYLQKSKMAKGGRTNVSKSKTWKQEWTTTKGESGYDILEIVDTDYFSNRYSGGKVVKSKIIESSKQERVGKFEENSKIEMRKIFSGKYPFAYPLDTEVIMAKGGEVSANEHFRSRGVEFLRDDLEKLQQAIQDNNSEEIQNFFSYWGQHLNMLETDTNERMYNFLKDDMAQLEKGIEENNQEEIDKFFSYWNYHLSSLKMAKGGRTRDMKFLNKGEDYEVRYAKGRNRRGYKSAFANGGEVGNTTHEKVTLIFDGKEHKYDMVFVDGTLEDVLLPYTSMNTPLFDYLEKEFDDWLEYAGREYEAMYFSDEAIYSKRGAIRGAMDVIEETIYEDKGKKKVYNLDKGEVDFMSAFS